MSNMIKMKMFRNK